MWLSPMELADMASPYIGDIYNSDFSMFSASIAWVLHPLRFHFTTTSLQRVIPGKSLESHGWNDKIEE